LCCGLLVAAFGVGTADAQAPAGAQAGATQTSTSQTAITQDEIVLQGDTTPRGALPTLLGDTGLWFVPTAETLPARRLSFSLFRANYDRPQGLTDVNQIGLTAAIGLGDRFELFGSWGVVRYDRDLRPFFVASDTSYGGIAQEFPYVRRGWSKTLGGPLYIGGKYNLISQSRGDALSLAPRFTVKLPIGAPWSSTNDYDLNLDLIASREFAKKVELTGMAGGTLRADPDEFSISDGIKWGIGAGFPSRGRVRGLAEFTGEWVFDQFATVNNPPFVAEDGSVAPLLSRIHDPADFKVGVVWQASKGAFVHTGFSFTQGVSTRAIGPGPEVSHNGWGWDIRLGWHPGVTPARERQHIIKETTTVTNTITPPPAPAPVAAPNRAPVFNGTISCDPCTVEPGGQSRLSSSATDPEGGPVTYRWTAPNGSFNPTDTANTTFTAPGQEGNVPITLTATDNQNNSSTSALTLQVVRREVITFEDVHFQFDRFNLRPDALKMLDDAVAKLQRNPNVRITIEGHCDSIGTTEYNLALGERRASSVRDYLANRGIAANRIRTISYGETMPVGNNNTAQGRAMNRRAHLVVIMETVQ